jgi:hypothetical protein
MVMEIKTTAQLDAESFEDLVREGIVTNLTAGARARGLLQIVNRRLGRAYETLKFNVAMGFVTTASGYFLDLIGTLVGVARRDASAGVVKIEDENLKFYVLSGTLASVLGSNSIPTGTAVASSDNAIQYLITQTVAFDDVATEVFVPAVAAGPGTEYRVGRNVLRTHTLGNPNVLVTNAKAITTGEDLESDDNYRYRISNSRAVRETANLTAVRLAMLPVPEVSDIVMKEYPGYIEALIIPTGNNVSSSTLEACRFLGLRAKAGGVRLITRGPRMIPFETFHQITANKDVPNIQFSAIRRAVKQSVLDYFDDIRLGGIFVVQQLNSRVQAADPRIFDHRLTCLVLRRQPQLLRNHQLYDDELFSPDPESENPVAVVVA